eukprot:6314749-Amphidinium_carterae.2
MTQPPSMKVISEENGCCASTSGIFRGLRAWGFGTKSRAQELIGATSLPENARLVEVHNWPPSSFV